MKLIKILQNIYTTKKSNQTVFTVLIVKKKIKLIENCQKSSLKLFSRLSIGPHTHVYTRILLLFPPRN